MLICTQKHLMFYDDYTDYNYVKIIINVENKFSVELLMLYLLAQNLINDLLLIYCSH